MLGCFVLDVTCTVAECACVYLVRGLICLLQSALLPRIFLVHSYPLGCVFSSSAKAYLIEGGLHMIGDEQYMVSPEDICRRYSELMRSI